MFPKQNLEKQLNVQIATSNKMDNAISLWLQMYKDEPPWLGSPGCEKTMCLPSSIAEEFARLILTEFEFRLAGSERADFLNEQFAPYLTTFNNTIELWGALGGMAIKPFVSGEDPETGKPTKIEMDIIQANKFYPTAFSEKKITGAVFVDSKREGEYLYTRLEHHNLVGEHYTVVNKAYRSERLTITTAEDDLITAEYPLQQEVPLETIDEWAALEPIVEMDGIKRPLFLYVRIPRANNKDVESPLGASVYSKAVEAIRDTDEQYTEIRWEYKSKEAAIHASNDLFDLDRNGKPILPEGKERVYQTYEFEGKTNAGYLQAFSPDIRDSSMYKGLNEQLRHVEFLCGLAYGTISDPATIDRTATEVIVSKQRSYTAVSNMQKAWDMALTSLIEIMEILCDLYQIVPPGNIEKTCNWGDGVKEDTDVEYQRRWSMVMAGKMKLEKFYSWYFGCSEEEAKEYIPEETSYPPEE